MMIAQCEPHWTSTRTFWRVPRSSRRGVELPQGVFFPSWPVARWHLENRSPRKRNGVPLLPERRGARLVTPEIVNRLRDEP